MNTLDDLLAALAAAPDLKGARCKGSTLWDVTDDPETVEYTTNQCLSCPALEACRDWVASLSPRKRPIGQVVAGQVNREKPAGGRRKERVA